MLFTADHIAQGSMSIEYAMPDPEQHDSVRVKYWDYRLGRERSVLCGVDGEAAVKPVEVSLFGVDNEAHARREGEYLARAARYRRGRVSFGTELDGVALSYGELIGITHDLPQWGQRGLIVRWSAETLTATIDQALTWTSSVQHYMALRGLDGSMLGPLAVTAGEHEDEVRVTTATGEILDLLSAASARTPVAVAFGPGESFTTLARFVAFRPDGLLSGTVEAVIEDRRVHAD
jgi:predicted phage tail protein